MQLQSNLLDTASLALQPPERQDSATGIPSLRSIPDELTNPLPVGSAPSGLTLQAESTNPGSAPQPQAVPHDQASKHPSAFASSDSQPPVPPPEQAPTTTSLLASSVEQAAPAGGLLNPPVGQFLSAESLNKPLDQLPPEGFSNNIRTQTPKEDLQTAAAPVQNTNDHLTTPPKEQPKKKGLVARKSVPAKLFRFAGKSYWWKSHRVT